MMSDVKVTPPPSQLLTAESLAQMLALSKRQIFRLNSCGKVPAPIRIGGAVRWSAGEISDWLVAGAPEREVWNARKAVTK